MVIVKLQFVLKIIRCSCVRDYRLHNVLRWLVLRVKQEAVLTEKHDTSQLFMDRILI